MPYLVRLWTKYTIKFFKLFHSLIARQRPAKKWPPLQLKRISWIEWQHSCTREVGSQSWMLLNTKSSDFNAKSVSTKNIIKIKIIHSGWLEMRTEELPMPDWSQGTARSVLSVDWATQRQTDDEDRQQRSRSRLRPKNQKLPKPAKENREIDQRGSWLSTLDSRSSKIT